ncbi:MAG: hypothetical protein EZS28_053051, partial [Streblomastix strix]
MHYCLDAHVKILGLQEQAAKVVGSEQRAQRLEDELQAEMQKNSQFEKEVNLLKVEIMRMDELENEKRTAQQQLETAGRQISHLSQDNATLRNDSMKLSEA